MTLFDSVGYPSSLLGPHLPSTLGYTRYVTVTPDLTNPRITHIEWQPVIMAVKYIVYVSPTPTQRHKYAEVPRIRTTADFEVPFVVPDNFVFYVWVAYENAYGQQVFLCDQPAYTASNHAFDVNPMSAGVERDVIFNEDMKFYIEEIRRRNLAMLENDGEDFYLYIRRPYGMPCVCLEDSQTTPTGKQRVEPMYNEDFTELGKDFNPTLTEPEEQNEAKDPEYQSSYRCKECYGVGVTGGYFPKMTIKARYGDIPPQLLNFEEQGIKWVNTFNSWTLWHPRLHERDFIVRVRTGERFIISEVGQSEWRGMPMHQRFNAVAAPRSAIIFDVTDENIEKSLREENSWDVAKWNWGLWQ